MTTRKTINLTEADLLKVEQIVIDGDKDAALDFVKDVIKKQVDKESASQIKWKRI